jgi:hypothetical protein
MRLCLGGMVLAWMWRPFACTDYMGLVSLDNEVNVVVKYLLDNLIDFNIYTDATPFVAIHPPPAPTSSPARSNGDGAEGPANI